MASIDRHDEGFIGHGGTAPRTKSQQMRSTIFDNQWPDDTPAQPRRITSGKEVSADAMAAAAAFGHTPSASAVSGKSPSYHRAMSRHLERQGTQTQLARSHAYRVDFDPKPPPAVYEPPPPPPPPVTTKPSFSAPPAEKQYAQLIARLRDALKKRGAAGIQGLARNFRICDVDKSKELDRDELSKCLRLCKLDATDDDLELLFGHFDRSGDGQIDYEEFLKAVRGPLTGVRKKIVVAAFHKIDEYSGGTAEGRKDGVLTIDDIKGVYCTKEHPEVKAGRATGDSVLREFLQKFEGLYGNRDGKVSLKEWLDYYNDLSKSYDSDDHFCTMVQRSWADLKLTYVEEKEVKALEKNLRDSIFAKSKRGQEKRTLEKKFKDFDKDGSGAIEFKEFCLAMEMYGLSTAKAGGNGIPVERVQALFDRYDEDGMGSITYCEFSRALLDDPTDPQSGATARPSTASSPASTGLAMPSLGATPSGRPGSVGPGGHGRSGSTLMPATPGGQSSRRGPAATGAAWTQSSGIFR